MSFVLATAGGLLFFLNNFSLGYRIRCISIRLYTYAVSKDLESVWVKMCKFVKHRPYKFSQVGRFIFAVVKTNDEWLGSLEIHYSIFCF